MFSGERLLDLGGAEICVEAFGDPADDTVLLLAGAAQSMVWWDAQFCRRLADEGRHVVRYDQRDTGRSSATPVGAPDYTARDLVDDAAGILDALRVAAAHIVGMSMGGAFAQLLALERLERVATLTLVATSPAVPATPERALPGPLPAATATFTEPAPEPEWSDRDAVIDYRVESERPFAGSAGFDEQRCRRVAELEVDRTRDMAASLTNHFVLADGPVAEHGLDRITVPTLVIHGSDDPMFPVAHGHALAEEIPGAELLVLDGVGHEQPPPATWPTVIAAVAAHTSRR